MLSGKHRHAVMPSYSTAWPLIVARSASRTSMLSHLGGPRWAWERSMRLSTARMSMHEHMMTDLGLAPAHALPHELTVILTLFCFLHGIQHLLLCFE